MVLMTQGDQSTLLHDIIRTALEDIFIHCDFHYWTQEDNKRRKLSVCHTPRAAAFYEVLTIDLMKLGLGRMIVLGILWIGNQGGSAGNHPITMFPEEWATNTALLHSTEHAERTLPVMYFVDGVSRFKHIRVGVLLLRLGGNRPFPAFGRRTRVTGGGLSRDPGEEHF